MKIQQREAAPAGCAIRYAIVGVAAAAALIAIPACSTNTPGAAPTTVTTTVNAPATVTTVVVSPPPEPSSSTATSVSTPAPTPAGGCEVNAATAPVPAVDPYGSVPAEDAVSVTLAGIPSKALKPGAAPVEVDLSVCNDSPVDYPSVGVVLALAHCSCAEGGARMPRGTIDRFDAASGAWIPLDHPALGTGMDYLVGFTDVQPLPKGATINLRYRVALDKSMGNGEGGLSATAVTADGTLVQIGTADLPFFVAAR